MVIMFIMELKEEANLMPEDHNIMMA